MEDFTAQDLLKEANRIIKSLNKEINKMTITVSEINSLLKS